MPKIYLSPSNQDANLYATGSTNEMHQCDKIAKATETALKRCGFSVKVGKSGDTMKNRCAESDSFKADLHIPIHTNATAKHNITGGTLVILYKSSTKHNKAGKSILDAVGGISPGADYSLQYRQDLYELNTPNAISVYLEVEFHDTKTGSDWIRNNITSIGEAIAKGVCNYYGVKYKSTTNTTNSETSSNSDKLYRVQVGAFHKKSNAEATKKLLEDSGFEAIIVETG